MFSINEGQLQYNEPGVLTSISFGLATAGISGAVLKTSHRGFCPSRIINIGEKGAETFVSTGGTLSSGGGNVVSPLQNKQRWLRQNLQQVGPL